MTSELKPCPFCGGQAERIEVREDDGFENRGGVAIECRQCRASSHVEFGRVENLVSSWNTRATPSADTLEGLVRYKFINDYVRTKNGFRKRRIVKQAGGGEYVLHSEAAAVIAAKDGYISEIANHLDCEPDCDSILHTIRENEADKDIYKERAEAAEAKLAKIKDQEPVGVIYQGIFIKTDEAIKFPEYSNGTPLYAAPVSDSLKAEKNEN